MITIRKKQLDVAAILQAVDLGVFAVPAFNYSDVWDFLAILKAATESDSPVFVSSNQLVVTEIGVELCGALGAAAIGKARIPVIHHLDHCTRTDICCAAVDNAYPSVMIDASSRPLEENIASVRKVVEYGHPRGCLLRAKSVG